MSESGATVQCALELSQLVEMESDFLMGISGISTDIIVGDGMLPNVDDKELRKYYFVCGRSAMSLIAGSLNKTGLSRYGQYKILDFGAGFGRVARWLKGYFVSSSLVGYDIDDRAVEKVKKFFDIDMKKISRSWIDIPEEKFDVIWVGSLFTHISEKKSIELLSILSGILSEDGVLCFTFHGSLIAERLKSGVNNYGLEEAAVKEILEEYDRTGYGFRSYSNITDYGISVNTVEKLEGLCDKAGLRKVEFIPRGWAKHQDYFSVRNK